MANQVTTSSATSLMQLSFHLPDVTAMQEAGAALGQTCVSPSIIFLQGELGMGKTTLVRGFLRALGHQGVVKSPTYTFVETYHFTCADVYHFDLYRLQQPQELETLGMQDYFTPQAITLIEWPQRATKLLPDPDVVCEIVSANSSRLLKISAFTNLAKKMLLEVRIALARYLI